MDSSLPAAAKAKEHRGKLWMIIGLCVAVAIFIVAVITRNSSYPTGSLGNKVEATYSITMSSGGNDVVGYDIIFTYDPKMVTVGTVKSLDPQFQVVQSNAKEGMVAVTAIKLPSAQGASVFENKPVLSIPVTQAEGQKDAIRIVQELENNTTKLINTDNQKVYLSDEMLRITQTQ